MWHISWKGYRSAFKLKTDCKLSKCNPGEWEPECSFLLSERVLRISDSANIYRERLSAIFLSFVGHRKTAEHEFHRINWISNTLMLLPAACAIQHIEVLKLMSHMANVSGFFVKFYCFSHYQYDIFLSVNDYEWWIFSRAFENHMKLEEYLHFTVEWHYSCKILHD